MRSPKKGPGGLATAGRGRRVWGEQGRVPWVPSKRSAEPGALDSGKRAVSGERLGKTQTARDFGFNFHTLALER